ncbi:MAG: 23S rRNA (uracil(1939)-C(5))-methyltransferase RlmD [Chitinophagales bacterium]|nr:23S rRNA (uracil(1939)-C(5))-methyltransferase RlmD [Chitinophagales bacterium]MDW8427263.1 23S rRNA (uracil(1939)-C(5))-methyltransferase RlmD [Chitinophagales bacterium]
MRGVIESLEVTAFANEGRCIGHHEGKVVFVAGTIPGERIRARIVRNRKDYIEAELAQILEASPHRVEPFCQHYGQCGGCRWQHMQYEAQLTFKQQAVVDTLRRLGKVEPEQILPIIGADQTKAYRNKLEFTFSHREWQTTNVWRSNTEKLNSPALGYHWPGAFDRVFNVYTCHLQPSLSDEIRNTVRDYALQHGLSFFHLKKQVGLLRTLMIRMTTTGQTMVLLVFGSWMPQQAMPLLHFLHVRFPQITSLQYAVNTKRNDSIFDLDIHTYSGPAYIEERLAGLTFRISAKSFFQTNTLQAEKLVSCVREFCALTPENQVYDLYCGTGTMALALAPYCRQVIGIEAVPQAVADANENARINHVHNVIFLTGTIEQMLTNALFQQYGHPQVLVVDPPRAGLHALVVKQLLELAVPRLVYVSCNVATQARDLQMLASRYTVKRIRPLDLFPHTHHVENVAELVLRS